jgi:hypothetical protein
MPTLPMLSLDVGFVAWWTSVPRPAKTPASIASSKHPLVSEAHANPPILHRKETFLAPDHPLRERFARLSAQEEKQGLLDDTTTIGTRDGWQRRLHETGFLLRGHGLVKKR